MRQSILGIDPAKLDRFDSLYEEAIDLGAHPNEQGIRDAMQVKSFGLRSYVSNHLLMVGEGEGLNRVLDRTLNAGILALELLSDVFPDRYAEIKIADRLRELGAV